MSHEANATVVNPLPAPLRGSASVPGDKSISHRAVLFAAMAEGTSRLSGVLDSEDVRSSIRAVGQLGAQVSLEKQPDGSLAGGVTGWGAAGPSQPEAPIDCGNSGTTVRLLMGVLAPWNVRVELTGDDSLQRRPMRRITAPLMKMGARFEPEGRETLPLTVCGSEGLRAITYDAPMASAQLKTAVLLAGVYARGTTTLNEPSPSRNHTELMLPEFGVTTTAADRTASVTGPAALRACEVQVPGDPSSAAFLVCAAVLKPDSSIQVENVSLNTARIGFTRTLERMGADISVRHTGAAGKEPYGIVSACYTPNLHGCEVPAIVEGLETLGVDAWIDGNDLFVEGQPGLQVPVGAAFDSKNDHRLAMTWALAGLCGNAPVEVENFDSVKISYPQFLTDIERLAR